VAVLAVESRLELEEHPHASPLPFVAVRGGIGWDDEAGSKDIQDWELHSELSLVCPEVRERALELLPERDPDAFLTTPRVVLTTGRVDEAQRPTSLPVAVAGYTLWKLIETARTGLVVVAAIVALALLVEVLH
jgi:hypothetical protein